MTLELFFDTRFMVCSMHMSATTTLKETGLRLNINLPASNLMCDSGVVSCSLRIFPMYREHQRRLLCKVKHNEKWQYILDSV